MITARCWSREPRISIPVICTRRWDQPCNSSVPQKRAVLGKDSKDKPLKTQVTDVPRGKAVLSRLFSLRGACALGQDSMEYKVLWGDKKELINFI